MRSITRYSTHPEAPVGLVVEPGAEAYEATDRMDLVVGNEAGMPITVTESDYIAVGAQKRGRFRP